MTYRPEPAYYLGWEAPPWLREHWIAAAQYQDDHDVWTTLTRFECTDLLGPIGEASRRAMWRAILIHAGLGGDPTLAHEAAERWSGYLRIPAHEIRAGVQLPML